MKYPQLSPRFCVAKVLATALLLITLASPLPMLAQSDDNYSIFHNFTGYDGGSPAGQLVQASDGAVYGTTGGGGVNGVGTVYKITLNGTLTTLYSFTALSNGYYGTNGDGAYPEDGVIEGTDGNFYGVTSKGGTTGYGTVFKMTPAGSVTTLYSFDRDTSSPSGLVQGSDGNFYGVIESNLNELQGAVYQLTPSGGFTVLHSFSARDNNNANADGADPTGPLVQATDGNFYGTTVVGGLNGNGAIFQITAAGAFTTLHSFGPLDQYGSGNSDGIHPAGNLIQAKDGNLYGLAGGGGPNQSGTAFQITLAGALTVVHSFDSNSAGPIGMTQGSDGDFYGTTNSGGQGYGTYFRLTPTGVLTTLYEIGAVQGGNPGDLFQASDGNIYGPFVDFQATGGGYLFKLILHPAFFDGEVSLGDGVHYLAFLYGDYFGYYSFLSDPHYIYHFDLGYEYVFDAADGKSGVYLYDFKSSTFFYTSPTFPFPYLYDFTLNTVLYYYPDPNDAGHYNTAGVRYFYDFATGKIITK